MLLRFFRINDPYRLLGLLCFLVLLGMPHFIDPAAVTVQELRNFVLGEAIGDGKLMYASIIDSTAPIMAVIYGMMDLFFGRSSLAFHLMALLLIFFQASYFAILLINNKAYNDNNYVPALVFGLVCLFSFDLLSFSPELLGSTVLLLALNNLFKEIEFRIERDEIILNLGFYLGVASLLIFSYVVFLFATLIVLFAFTRLTVRKFFLLLFGFILPHGLIISFYYIKGETVSLFQNFYVPNLTIHGAVLIDLRSILVLAALPIVYFIFSLFMLNREARFTKYQSQLFQVMFQWMMACVIQAFVTRELTPHSLIIFIPSLAYFISHYLLLIRRKWIAETMLWIFLIGMVSINLMSRYNKIKEVQYSRLFPVPSPYSKTVEHKRVMILADDPAIYQNNELAGYFLDWKLSKEIFEQPDYYENVMIVNRSFKTDPPDYVIDPNNYLEKFLSRIPELQTRYKRDGIYYKKEKMAAR